MNRVNVRTRTDLVLAMAKMKEMGQVYDKFQDLVSACAKAVHYPQLKSHHLIALIRAYPEFKVLYHSHETSRAKKIRDAEQIMNRLSSIERRVDDLTSRLSKVVGHITKTEIPHAAQH